VLLCGARDWNNPRLLGQQPCERDLGGCRSLPSCDPGQQIDQSQIRLPILGREARDDVAEVGAVERRALIDLPREKALAQRTERNEANSQLLERYATGVDVIDATTYVTQCGLADSLGLEMYQQ